MAEFKLLICTAVMLSLQITPVRTKVCPMVLDECFTWNKMVSQNGKHLEQRLLCTNYTKNQTPALALKLKTPQEVKSSLDYTEIYTVDEIRKVVIT